MRSIPWIALAAAALLSCDGEPDHCRFDPECEGGVGGFCDTASDCDEGFCCDTNNCGGGMCTYRCSDDHECPDDMLCEHETCFFRCADDTDCAEGMSCEHGETICEWEND